MLWAIVPCDQDHQRGRRDVQDGGCNCGCVILVGLQYKVSISGQIRGYDQTIWLRKQARADAENLDTQLWMCHSGRPTVQGVSMRMDQKVRSNILVAKAGTSRCWKCGRNCGCVNLVGLQYKVPKRTVQKGKAVVTESWPMHVAGHTERENTKLEKNLSTENQLPAAWIPTGRHKQIRVHRPDHQSLYNVERISKCLKVRLNYTPPLIHTPNFHKPVIH